MTSRIRFGFLALIAAAAPCGCSRNPTANLDAPAKFFKGQQIGTSRDYGIVKWGNRDDHVATVHGFADDYAACKEITDALNANACKETGGEDCLYPYSCSALN